MTNYRRKKKPTRPETKSYQINGRIPHAQVRVIDDEGEMLGVFSLKAAIELAQESDKDIVLINPKAEPPVCKMIEYSKFKYQMEKAENNVKSKASETKILLVSVRISDNDLMVRARKGNGILEDGMKIKLQVKMRGREKAHPEVAEEMLKKFMSFITFEHIQETSITLEGDSYTIVLKSKK
jgi:translation initiation factor IF-3